MWELIHANKRKSIVLFICMGICLILLGFLVGSVFSFPDGGITGIVIALIGWLFLSLISYFSGDSILLAVSGAKEVTPDVHPQLFNVVEEMKIAANSPVMPRIYIIDEIAPNAFATGIKQEKCTIAVTAGLLSRLNRDELQGVIAHEMSHIINRDVLFITFAGMLLGSIVLISNIFLRGMWFSSGSSRRRYRSRTKISGGGGQIGLIILIVTIAFAILAPLLTRLLYFAVSRKREYLADASAVRLTRYPEGLASALEEISSVSYDLPTANKVTAPMFIVNPLKKKGMQIANLTSTHPPISERIKILRSMMHGANYLSYQKAFSNIRGKRAGIIPTSGLKDTEVIPIRKASVKKTKIKDKKKGMRDIGDLMRAINSYAFLICACGLRIKVPPDFKEPEIICPRCGRQHDVPFAELAAISAAAGVAVAEKDKKRVAQIGPKTYARKGTGWESFSCSCGRLLQISPAFEGSHIVCSTCGRETKIKN